MYVGDGIVCRGPAIKKGEGMDLQKPLVSICLITYNHEKYIRQAVDSILNQNMNFSYELLIVDDASTDHTQQILKENYSEIENVKLILWEKNSEGTNGYLVLQEARGKYIYYCEGDDFWIGQDGLQTLVDWLEAHEEYVGVCGRRITLSERTGFMFTSYDKSRDNKGITLDDFLMNRATFDFCTLLYRNFYHDGRCDYRTYLASRRVGDLTSMIYVLLHGKVFQLDKIVGVYRADRIKSAASYNNTTTPRRMFEEHMELISNLPNLIYEKLDYSTKKSVYVGWYTSSFSSTYEYIQQIPYLWKKVGLRMTIEYLKKWILSICN